MRAATPRNPLARTLAAGASALCLCLAGQAGAEAGKTTVAPAPSGETATCYADQDNPKQSSPVECPPDAAPGTHIHHLANSGGLIQYTNRNGDVVTRNVFTGQQVPGDIPLEPLSDSGGHTGSTATSGHTGSAASSSTPSGNCTSSSSSARGGPKGGRQTRQSAGSHACSSSSSSGSTPLLK